MTQRQPLENSYTMEEAAKVLRICRRMLQDLVARHPHYHANGNRKLFTETEILCLRQAMARDAKGPLTLPSIPESPTYKPRKENGLIYFICAVESGRVKIGFAINLDRRMKELQTGCPEKLVVLGTINGTRSEERALHKRFAEYRIAGEWFQNARPLTKYIARMAQ